MHIIYISLLVIFDRKLTLSEKDFLQTLFIDCLLLHVFIFCHMFRKYLQNSINYDIQVILSFPIVQYFK